MKDTHIMNKRSGQRRERKNRNHRCPAEGRASHTGGFHWGAGAPQSSECGMFSMLYILCSKCGLELGLGDELASEGRWGLFNIGIGGLSAPQ